MPRRHSKKDLLSSLLKPVYISDQLATFTNLDKTKQFSRTEITKLIYKYIKENGLLRQDSPIISLDLPLQQLLNCNQPAGQSLELTFFKLPTYLKNHFFSIPTADEIANQSISAQIAAEY